MTPSDPTLTHTPQESGDSSEAAWDAGLAAAFGPAETGSHPPAADPAAGAVLAGKYRLAERIGEGGMGSVWVAHQSEPVKRKVAVKLIKAGMDSKSVLARFEAERQALAVMDHPNIAKVLDGGLTPDGRPFFVMELVKGVPITEYCDARKLTPRERLELFVPVCQAIQHAHQKGIIHRDIKPSNVLVALYDDRPVPKVIDFGVAKATGGTLTERTIETAFGGVVGTPQYMSPEQASLNNLDIDTRSDVYSLGVLLYELLTGSPPFARKELEKKGLLEILRVVREEEPPRPSTKLSTADALPSLSASRGTEPKKLTGLLRNELDWIVMKALEKDRTRRYETANGFAADVQRHLSGEPVQAVPPSVGYRLRKFVRKHKTRVAAATAFVLLLLTSVAVSSFLAVQARRAESLAEDRRIEAAEQAREAAGQAGRAQGAMMAANAFRIDAARAAMSSRVDLDLIALKDDSRLGLLRLCQTRKAIGDQYEEHKKLETMTNPLEDRFEENLSEFVTMAVLAVGQDYAPLLPPLVCDPYYVEHHHVSPAYKTLLTLGRGNRVSLWDMRSGRLIASLNERSERVLNLGFSPDGKTIFTDDSDNVARFWNVADGRLRGKTKASANRYDEPDRWFAGGERKGVGNGPVQISNDRLLTRAFMAHPRSDLTRTWQEPVELWDTATGRLVRRLDTPGRSPEHVAFSKDGRWVLAIENDTTVLVISANDGQPVARMKHPDGETVLSAVDSPSGNRVATLCLRSATVLLHVWETDTWREGTPVRVPTNELPVLGGFKFWTDDLVSIEEKDWLGGPEKVRIYRHGQPNPFFEIKEVTCTPLLPSGEYLLTNENQVYDTKTGKRLVPPPGRKFHPSIAKFATDGRFVLSKYDLIDTRTDKSCSFSSGLNNIAGRGPIVGIQNWHDGAIEIRPLPMAALKDIPADLLELWAQVAVRGELGPDGAFVPWNEPTWEKKRQELAARPVPRVDVPFPGHVATSRLHWLQQEYRTAKDDEKPRLAQELLRLAEALGDRTEASRWRKVHARLVLKELPTPKVD